MRASAIPCFVIVSAIALFCAMPSSPQTNVATAPQTDALPLWSDPEFAGLVYDVVSIKPHKNDPVTDGTSLGTRATPDGYSAAFPVAGLIYEAYRTEHYRISGASGWMNSEMYDVEAKMEPEVMEALKKLSPEKRRLARQHMLQVLLRDYFKAVVHVEPREVPAYDLVVAKNGPKLKQAADSNPSASSLKTLRPGTMIECIARGEPVTSLLGELSVETGQPVYDKTGLTAMYDYTLQYTPQSILMASQTGGDSTPLTETAPPIKKAIEEQLGLKLVSTTGMMNYIIIDHVERPNAN